MENPRPRIAIVGGGFAGLACARALGPRRFDVLLVDSSTQFEFVPNIHEIVSGVKIPETVQLPLRPVMDSLGHRFRRAKVESADTEARQLVLSRGRPLDYDTLVMAAGATDATFGVPGVREHSVSFKTASDCQQIARRLARLARRRQPAQVVIIGGGITGIEALGEILRRHRNSGLAVTVVEAKERVLPQQPAGVDAYVQDLSAPYNVELLTGTAVESIGPDFVELVDGRTLPSDLTLWTGGPAPQPLLSQSGLAGPGQWAPVDDYLRSTVAEDVYVAGDAAGLPRPQPRQAYHSLDMGAAVARNLLRRSRGRQPSRYRPSAKPVLISFGDLGAILVAGPCALAGPALGAGKELIFEAVMAQLDDRRGASPLLAALGRGELAVRRLAWPTARSLQALRRQFDLRPLF